MGRNMNLARSLHGVDGVLEGIVQAVEKIDDDVVMEVETVCGVGRMEEVVGKDIDVAKSRECGSVR